MKRITIFITAAALSVAALPALADEGDIQIPIGAEAVLFRQDDGDIEVWTPDSDDNWNLALRLDEEELDAVDATPEETELVESAGGIAVYKSPNGEWSVASAPDEEGKVRVVVFDEEFFYSHEYEYNVYGEAAETDND
jgi:hypothetical protein